MRRLLGWLLPALLVSSPVLAANTLKHRFVSPKPDVGDPTLVRPSNWNDEHVFAGGANGQVLIRDTGQSDGASWTDTLALSGLSVTSPITSLTVTTLTVTTLALTSLSSPLALSNGGLGFASGTTGDLLYFSAGTTLSKLADAADGNVLRSGGVGAAPLYGKVRLSGATTDVTGTLGPTVGGTGLGTYTQGDLLYSDAANSLARLGVGSNGALLRLASGIPAWLAPGSNGDVLKITAGAPTWSTLTVGGDGSPGATYFDFIETSAPSTPAANHVLLYVPTETPAVNRLEAKDATGQVLVLSGVLFRDTGNPFKDVNTTASATSIYTTPPTIKGGTLGTGRGLRFTVIGDFLNNLGASHGFTVTAHYGATTIATFAQATIYPQSATRYAWRAVISLVAIGATNAQVSYGQMFLTDTVGVSGTSLFSDNTATDAFRMSMHNGIAEDSTADKTWDVKLQPDTSSANVSVRVFAAWMELL